MKGVSLVRKLHVLDVLGRSFSGEVFRHIPRTKRVHVLTQFGFDLAECIPEGCSPPALDHDGRNGLRAKVEKPHAFQRTSYNVSLIESRSCISGVSGDKS